MDMQHAIDRIKVLETEKRDLLTVINSLKEKRSEAENTVHLLKAQLRAEHLIDRRL